MSNSLQGKERRDLSLKPSCFILCPVSCIPEQPFQTFRQRGQGQGVLQAAGCIHSFTVSTVHNLTGSLSWSGALRRVETQRQLHSSPPLCVLLSAPFGESLSLLGFFLFFFFFFSPFSADLCDKKLLTKWLEVAICPRDCEIFIRVNEWNFQPLDWQERLGRRQALSAGTIWWIYHQNDWDVDPHVWELLSA